jgi:bifunctional oligoribonuclease and PAP phosphatase NrnA
MDLDMEGFIRSLHETAEQSNRILITSHKSPDDDAIGSMLALYNHLVVNRNISESNIRLRILGKLKETYNYFEHSEKIQGVDMMAGEAESADMVILLDGNTWTRFSESIPNTGARTFCIDHHPKDIKLFDYEYIDKCMTSTTEIIYELFYKGNNIERRTCESILAGILGDTGQLRFIDYKKAKVLDAVKDLVEQGKINIDSFLSKYSKLDLHTFSLLKMIMQNASIRKTGDWPPYMVSYLSEAAIGDLKANDISIRDASHAFTQYLKNIEGVDWGFIITPRGGYCGISFRSLEQGPNVRLLCEKMGIGGGHDRAAGANIDTECSEEAARTVEKWLSSHQPIYDSE